jgi:hypothetical protein
MGISKASGHFLALSLANDLDLRKYEELFGIDFEMAFFGLITLLEDIECKGTVDRISTKAPYFALAAVRAVAMGKPEEAYALASEFSNHRELYATLATYCKDNLSEKYFNPVIAKVDKMFTV